MKVEKTCSCGTIINLEENKATAAKNEFGFWVPCPSCTSCNLFPKYKVEEVKLFKKG